MFPVFSKCMSYHKFKCSECRHLDRQQPPTYKSITDCQSPLRVVQRVGVFQQFNINSVLKLKLLHDFTSALDVSCLIMSNKQLVRFVAWIEMWVNRRGCVCPPRHFNKARFVGPGSLKSGHCEKWTHWNWAATSQNYWAGDTGSPGPSALLTDQNKVSNLNISILDKLKLVCAISACHQVLICLK